MLLESVLFLDEYFSNKKINEALAWRDIRAHIIDSKKPSNNKQSTPCCSSCGATLYMYFWCYECDTRAIPK